MTTGTKELLCIFSTIEINRIQSTTRHQEAIVQPCMVMEDATIFHSRQVSAMTEAENIVFRFRS